MTNAELNYPDYLKMESLLDLQGLRSDPPEHDELLFIIVHQSSELWMKQLLHELDKIKVDLSRNHLFRVISSFDRCESIVILLAQHMRVLESMTPMSFGLFRDRLDTASGFQSMQFRELEFVLGMKNEEIFRRFPASLFGYDAAAARLEQPSVVDAFYDFLGARGVTVPASVLDRPVSEATIPNEEVQDGIFGLYRRSGQCRMLFEAMVDFDEAMQGWRYQHVKLTERSIGNKQGTGGSPGVEYLRQTIYKQAFPDLWAIRHRF